MNTDKVTRSDDYETTDASKAREYIAALRQAMEQVPSYLKQQAEQAADEWNVQLQQVVA